VTLACEIDDAMGEVQWLRNGEEIKPDKRIQIVKDGRKRKLVIKDCKVTDAGQFKCTTNADTTESEIIINCKFVSSYAISATNTRLTGCLFWHKIKYLS